MALKCLVKPDISRARCLVNIFTDIVVDSFWLERSPDDEKKVLLGWKEARGAGRSHAPGPGDSGIFKGLLGDGPPIMLATGGGSLRAGLFSRH